MVIRAGSVTGCMHRARTDGCLRKRTGEPYAGECGEMLRLAYPRMPILTSEGQLWVEISDPAERSLVGSYWNAAHRYRDDGELAQLDAYAGVRVAGRLLVTDPDEIEFWAARGDTDFPEIYEPSR